MMAVLAAAYLVRVEAWLDRPLSWWRRPVTWLRTVPYCIALPFLSLAFAVLSGRRRVTRSDLVGESRGSGRAVGRRADRG
jgi:uncharacterized protein (TIGR03382 family)